MREAGATDPDDLFDRILSFNWQKFLNLLAVLEPHEGDMVSTLARTARYQLEAMSHCIGSRELEVDAQLAADGDSSAAAAVAGNELWQISIQ